MQVPGLLALIKKPDLTGYWLLDLKNHSASDFHNGPEEQYLLSQNIAVFVDAKRDMKELKLKPSPDLKIICLATIKKLIAQNHLEDINVPDLFNKEDALAWFESAMHNAFSCIEKLHIKELSLLESRVVVATLAMEQKGLFFNKALWRTNLKNLHLHNTELKEKLESILVSDSGFLLFGANPVDLNNHQAVKEALEKLTGKNLKSASRSSLQEIDHEAATLVIAYRENARLLSTFGEDFLAKFSDRLRGDFSPIGSASGRFSCHDPNLLALPNHSLFQACLRPEDPYELIHFDYGACELRILAALSKDKALLKIFNEGQDIHSMVATAIFNQEVSKNHNSHLRDQAKVLNFGIIYGMGEHALARQLKISLPKAEDLLRKFFTRFSAVQSYLLNLEKFAQKKGYAKTALNRRGYFGNSEFNPRVARNLPIQGTGADIIKLALCRVYKRLVEANLDAHVVNVVHDEVVIECHKEHKDKASLLVKHEMEQAFSAILPGVVPEVSIK